MKLQWFSLLYSRAMWTEMKVTLTLLMLKVCRKCDCFTTVYVTIWIMWPVYKKRLTDEPSLKQASIFPKFPTREFDAAAETSLKSQLRSRFTVDWLLHDLRLPFPHKRTPGLRRSSTHCIQRQTVHVRFKNNCFGHLWFCLLFLWTLSSLFTGFLIQTQSCWAWGLSSLLALMHVLKQMFQAYEDCFC